MRRRRLRRWAKWACTVAAVLAVAVAVFSGFRSATYVHVSKDSKAARTVVIAGGQLAFYQWRGYDMMGVPMAEGWSIWEALTWSWGVGGTFNERDWHGGILWGRPNALVGPEWYAGVSVVYPVALTLIPAALLWYANRRRAGPGSCAKCGYSRRGLAADAKCPECGTAPSS
jgi:hypothetical protein